MVKPQTNYTVDWLAESKSHFLGHTIVKIWPKKNLYTMWPNYHSFIVMGLIGQADLGIGIFSLRV